MSQQLTPINGGIIPEVGTTVSTPRINVLSPQYIQAFDLQNRPTEWVPGGRPIYRRLPAASETYQINFFNTVTESNLTRNNKIRTNIEEVGYVYVPWDQNIDGSTSCQVISSDNKQMLMIKSGVLIWRYGRSEVLPTLVDLKELEILSGKYEVAYQMLYDDAPVSNLYAVKDFALTGLPLTVSSNTDTTVGWRHPAINAFLNNGVSRWATRDTYFPAFAQPTTPSFIQWQSTLLHAYSKVFLRCSSGTAYTGTATLSYTDGVDFSEASTVSVSQDDTGQFFEFAITKPALQSGWRVSFSSAEVSIQSITVDGTLTVLTPQSSPSPKSVLVMYPVGARPKTVENSQGNQIPATYITLAYVDIDAEFRIQKIQDTREIIHRDYVPVADWLTAPFDNNLIELYKQVSSYAALWMVPNNALKQEYVNLKSDQILVEA